MTQTERKESTVELETVDTSAARERDLLERVDAPLDTAHVTLTSGRRYELRAD